MRKCFCGYLTPENEPCWQCGHTLMGTKIKEIRNIPEIKMARKQFWIRMMILNAIAIPLILWLGGFF